jgi:hypothetical protein
MKPLHAVLILLLLFAAMSAVTWETWANPVVDSGREMNAPLRLLQGERLYSDVYYLYGPVAPYFNALLYKIFGIHLRTLYAAGLAGGLLLVLLAFYIGKKIMPALEAMLAAAAVLLFCVFKQSGNLIFPYSHSVLYGTLLGTLSLAAQLEYIRFNRMISLFAGGALAGLSLCCKLEFGFAAAVTLAVAVFFSPRGCRARNSGIAFLSLLIFPLLIYGSLLIRIPAGSLFKDTYLLPGYIPSELLHYNRIKLGLDHPGRTIGEIISSMALLSAAAGALALAGIRLAGESIKSALLSQGARRLWLVTGVSFAWLLVHGIFLRARWDLNPFRSLPILSLAMIAYYFMRRNAIEKRLPSDRALFLVSVFSLAVLMRVIPRVPAGGSYGSGMIPVPLLLFVCIAATDLPFLSAAATRFRRRAILVSLSIAIAATMMVFAYRQVKNPSTLLRTTRGELRIPNAHSVAISQAVDFIARNTSPGEPLLTIPEGSCLNFIADRPVAVRYEIMTPGFLDLEEEQATIRRIQEKKVRYIFLFNRATSEFGPKTFGRDYCRTLMAWIESNYEFAGFFGNNVSPDMQIGDPAFFIKCYRKKLSELR